MKILHSDVEAAKKQAKQVYASYLEDVARGEGKMTHPVVVDKNMLLDHMAHGIAQSRGEVRAAKEVF